MSPSSNTISSNFEAQQNGTIAVTTASASIQFAGNGIDFMFVNMGSAECFVAVGPSTVTAVAGGSTTVANDGSISVPPGAVVI